MITKVKFDNIIKENVIKKYGQSVIGYKTDETEDKIYENYYNASEFDRFLSDMKSSPYSEIYFSYHGGNGGGQRLAHGPQRLTDDPVCAAEKIGAGDDDHFFPGVGDD